MNPCGNICDGPLTPHETSCCVSLTAKIQFSHFESTRGYVGAFAGIDYDETIALESTCSLLTMYEEEPSFQIASIFSFSC